MMKYITVNLLVCDFTTKSRNYIKHFSCFMILATDLGQQSITNQSQRSIATFINEMDCAE